jgi:ABC-type polar amino acid transport system ATPase subunit
MITTAPSHVAIAVDAIEKSFGPRAILRGVSFDVKRGEAVALVGPSGGGKSTLLRCMHGLETFDSGTITIDGALLRPGGAKENPLALRTVRAKAGLVFQQWHLFAHMTALENIVEAPVHVLGVAKSEAEARARGLLEKVGMSHRANVKPRLLSGGEQQRVAIARALAMQPSVLFMDEPTSALDPQRVFALVELLRILASEGLTLVMVTHDMRFAAELADRAIVLAGGQIIEEGVPRDMLASPNHPTTRAFLGMDA